MGTLQLTYNDVLMFLSIVAVAMLIILLYHLIFASVSLKRMAQRMDDLSKDVEAIILKPISAIDYVLEWFLAVVESMRDDSSKKKDHHKK